MDVHCARCGTEYELDDGRVGAQGTTVKCSTCGHVFKVRREAAEPSGLDADIKPTGDWLLKKSDGSVVHFKELTTLQKWIVERKATRVDEISKTGRSWKQLGGIAELASFFQVVDAADAALRQSTPAGPGQPPPVQVPISAVVAAPPQADAGLPTSPARFEDLDHDDPVLGWRRRRRRTGWSAAIAVLVVVVVALVVVGRLAVVGPGHLDAPLAQSAGSALFDDDQAVRDAALTALAALTAVDQPEAGVWRARLLIARGGDLFMQARLRDALHDLDPAAQDGQGLRQRGADALAQAFAIVSELRTTQGPMTPEVHLAIAARHLERGETKEQRAALGEAAHIARDELERRRVDDESRVQLLVAEARASLEGSDVGAARAKLAKLDAVDEGRVRAAAAELAASIVLKTRPTTDPADVLAAQGRMAVLKDGDPRRLLLERLITLAQAPPPAPAAPRGVVGAEPTASSLASSPPETYESIMPRAERALLAERSQEALELYRKATQLRPDVARPWLKLGWAAIDLSRTSEAITAFRRALEINESLSEAQFGLAEALRFAGRTSDAVAAYRTYLAMDPEGKDAAIAKNAILQLE